jgi:rubredoxin
MSEIKVRDSIPDAWANKGCCPLCAASKMQVQHQSAGPDQLRCDACGVVFEVELGSNVVLVEVSGPATLSNVYYIAISCP